MRLRVPFQKRSCVRPHMMISPSIGCFRFRCPRCALFRQTPVCKPHIRRDEDPNYCPAFRTRELQRKRHHSVKTAFIVPRRTTATFPRSPGYKAVAEQPDLIERYVAGFMVAPCGTTPSVTNRQSAINSFLASATIITFRKRRPVWPVLSRNQVTCAAPGWKRSQSHANSTIVVLSRLFPAFPIPCSRSTPPLL